jgi:hypothetical protein
LVVNEGNLLAKKDFLEIQKGVYVLKQKSSRPFVKIDSNEVSKTPKA